MLEETFKKDIQTDIQNAVFIEDWGAISTKLWNLVKRNHRLGGSEWSFLIGNRRYAYNKEGLKNKAKPIHPTLGNEARELLVEYDRMIAHLNKFDGFMNMIWPYCQTVQDLRDVLPNVVVEALPEDHYLRNFKRVRDPYAVMGNHPGHRLSYDGMLKVFFQYLAKRLVR